MRIPALSLAALTLCLAAGSALAQKTQLLVYTALETDQLKAEGLAGWAGLLSVRVSIYREGL